MGGSSGVRCRCIDRKCGMCLGGAESGSGGTSDQVGLVGVGDGPPGGDQRTRARRGVVANPAVYALADWCRIRTHGGGRPRMYPVFMWVLFDALLSVYGSARGSRPSSRTRSSGTSSEHSSRSGFRTTRSCGCRRPRCAATTTSTAAPATSPTPKILAAARRAIHRQLAADQAGQLGLLDPDGPGSWTHPDLCRMLYADGKVITPLFKAKPGDTASSTRRTGEIRYPTRRTRRGAALRRHRRDRVGHQVRHRRRPHTDDRTAGSSSTSTGSPRPAAKPATAMDCFTRLAPAARAPRASSTTPPSAASTTRHLLRDLGLLPVNRVTAAKAAASSRGARAGQRDREVDLRRDQDHHHAATAPRDTVDLFAQGGAHRHRRTHRHRRPRPSPSSRGSAPTATPTRPARTAGTTTTGSPTTSAAAPSPSGSTATTTTRHGSSTAPRTSGPSRPATPTSSASTGAATTPRPSTAPSTTPSGSAEPTASATSARPSTCSPTPSASTPSPCTATGSATAPPPRRLTHPATTAQRRPRRASVPHRDG